MKLEKVEYSKLKENDRVLIQNHNKQCGILIFKAKVGKFVKWETLEGKEAWDDIDHLKEKKTKLVGVIKD